MEVQDIAMEKGNKLAQAEQDREYWKNEYATQMDRPCHVAHHEAQEIALEQAERERDALLQAVQDNQAEITACGTARDRAESRGQEAEGEIESMGELMYLMEQRVAGLEAALQQIADTQPNNDPVVWAIVQAANAALTPPQPAPREQAND